MTRRPKLESMLNIKDVARILNVHINTIRRWSNEGALKSYRLGPRGDRRFRLEDIIDFIVKDNSKIKE